MTTSNKQRNSVNTDPDATGSDQQIPGKLQGAASGVLGAASALAIGELAASFVSPIPGPVIGVANRVIDLAPNWFVDFGKAIFGLSDKPALVLGTIIISIVLGAVLGIAARTNRIIGIVGIAAFGLIGLLAIGSDAQGSWFAGLIISLLAVGAGIGALLLLLSTKTGADRAEVGLQTKKVRDGSNAGSPTNPPVSRWGFLNYAGLVGATAAVAAVGSREIRARSSASQARDAVELSSASADELDAMVAKADSSVVGSTPGISPIVVPNGDFYLIDTALTTPQVDPANWSLTIRGLVDNEVTYTYDDLLERAQTIAPVTLSCVSNEVGGNLVGNAIWRGVPLTELLDEAGVRPEATQIASRSVDGWNCGFPTEAAYDGRTALVAIGMNDEPLPLKHGFPARLVVSGLYGYVSATKWLKEIELTTIEDFDGYWIPRGWSKLGPVKTQSRIDTPGNGQEVAAGTDVAIAGVAWAPDTGIAKVEVQIDEGEWQEATLGESLGSDAWRQWVLPWGATGGTHSIQVRATDESGFTQPPDFTPPAPNGASGWHRIGVIGV